MPNTDSRLDFNRMVVNPVPGTKHRGDYIRIGESDESKATRNLREGEGK